MLSLHSNLGSDRIKRKNPSQRLDELMQKAKRLLNKGAKREREREREGERGREGGTEGRNSKLTGL